MGTTPDLVVIDSSVTGALDPVLLLAAFRDALAAVGVRGVADGELIAALGRGCAAAIQDIAAGRGASRSAALRAVRLLTAHTVRDLDERRHPRARAAGEALAGLRGAGVACVLVSDLPAPALDALVRGHGWRPTLRATVSVDLVRHDRPAPDVIHEAMAHAGIRHPSRVANIAGHYEHLEAGRAAAAGWNVAVGWAVGCRCRPLVDLSAPDLRSATERLLSGTPPAEVGHEATRFTTSPR